MTAPTIELLINAGSRRSQAVKAEILRLLDSHGLNPKLITELKRGESLNDALAPILKRQPGLLIVGGGDGTLSDVADHLIGTPIELGILPLGTTNNFARSLNIPTELPDAIALIAQQSAKPVDLGKLDQDYFTNVAGIGLSASVAGSVTDASKRRWGRPAYAITAVKLLLRHSAFSVTLQDKDKELSVNLETHQLIIANGRYHAGRQIAHDARIDNRELVIFALGGRSRWSLIWHMLDFYAGRRKSVAHTSYLIGRDVIITTDRPQPIELDGEVKQRTPAHTVVSAGAIRVRHAA